MELGSDLHFLAGPAVAFAFIVFLAGMLRWTYGHQRDQPGPNPNRRGGDTGLLKEVAAVPTVEAADVLRTRLARDGIRSSVSRSDDGTTRILVFAKDEIDAKLVLSQQD